MTDKEKIEQILDIVKEIRTNPICVTDARLVDAIELLAGEEISSKKTVRREAAPISNVPAGSDTVIAYRFPYGANNIQNPTYEI